MKPLREFQPSAPIEGLLFDLDDTFLTRGTLLRVAYDALWELREAGFGLVVVTGRPASWGRVLALQWPIDAILTENGAITLARAGARVVVEDPAGPAERARRRAALAELVQDVAREVPEARLTDDVSGRISDVTWDVAEHEHLPEERRELVRSIAKRHGAHTSTSSVHLHATLDEDDKATGAFRYLARTRALDAAVARERWAFVGDSGNDRPCFAAFTNTFGVANVGPGLAPRFVADAEMGEGFAEIAHALLRCKIS